MEPVMEDQCHTHGKQSIVTIESYASRSRYTTPITLKKSSIDGKQYLDYL
jgi:hypothetical protein